MFFVQTVVSPTGAMAICPCDPHVHSQDGMTFLMVASKHNNTNLATSVLQHKANINQQNEIEPVRKVACGIFPTHNVT